MAAAEIFSKIHRGARAAGPLWYRAAINLDEICSPVGWAPVPVGTRLKFFSEKVQIRIMNIMLN
jgi:hypothetical protein